jgi:hypothetical protein
MLDANIFVRIHFKNKPKKWNSIFTISYVSCKFEQNLSKEVVKDVNGLRPTSAYTYTQKKFLG